MPAQVSSDPVVGALLGGRYRVIDVIGHGGAGRVYRARQEPMGRLVAVKVLHAELDPDGQFDFQARFLREAAQAGRIQHPHVVTVHDYGRTPEGACYIVMELLRGQTLRSLLRDGILPLAQALRIFEQLVLGLRACHASGLVHRDVKPSNVILVRADDGGHFVKLFDFGLVKGDDETTITQTGMFMGTPQYVAPEQAQGKSADGRSDLYSAGVILFRMLCGVLPFTADTPMAVAWMHIREVVPAMSARAPDVVVPATVEAFTQRLLAKDPDDRFVDADAVLAELQQLRQGLGLTDEATLLTPVRDPEDAPSLSSLNGVAAVDDALEEVTVTESPRRRRPAGFWWWGTAAVVGTAGAALWLNGAEQEAASTEPAAEPVADTQVAEPEPQPPPVHEVIVLISSEPAGAVVWLGEVALGLTPLARGLAVDPALDEGGSQPFRVALDGHHDVEVVLDLDQETAAGHAVLAPLPRKRSTRASAPVAAAAPAAATAPVAAAKVPEPQAAASSSSLVADGVRFDAEEAALALAWVNGSDAAALRGSGIAGRQVNIILDLRPFADLGSFAATPWIGPKTVERVKTAVAP